MNNEKKENIKEIFLCEYNSLRQEVIQRISTQGTIIGWIIGITGTFIGINVIGMQSMDGSLIVNVLNGCPEALTLFGFLCFGYTIVIDLLWGFWIYQLFHISYINCYITSIRDKLKELLDFHDDLRILYWQKFKNNDLSKCSFLGAAGYLQPLTFPILSFLGIIGVLVTKFFVFNGIIILVLSIIFSFLVIPQNPKMEWL